MAAWIRKTLSWRIKLFCGFVEKWPFSVKFSKFCSERIHRNIDRPVVFKVCAIWPTRNWYNRALSDKKFAWFSTSRYCANRLQHLAGPDPESVYWKCSRFHQNRFTFGGGMPERVNTVKVRSKVNPRFGWSLARSRIARNHIAASRRYFKYTEGYALPICSYYSATNSNQQTFYEILATIVHRLCDIDCRKYFLP